MRLVRQRYLLGNRRAQSVLLMVRRVTCEARKARDQVWRCIPCGLAWDADDPAPPACPRTVEDVAPDPLRQTVAGMAFQAEAAGRLGNTVAKDRARGILAAQSRIFGASIGNQACNKLCELLVLFAGMHPEAMHGLTALTAVGEIARLILDEIVKGDKAGNEQREALRETLLKIVQKTTHSHFKPEMYNDGTSPDPR